MVQALAICLTDSFINVMKLNFRLSQIITISKLPEPKLMRTHFRSLIFTKYLSPEPWIHFCHFITYIEYINISLHCQFSDKKLLMAFKIRRKGSNMVLLNCKIFPTVSKQLDFNNLFKKKKPNVALSNIKYKKILHLAYVMKTSIQFS